MTVTILVDNDFVIKLAQLDAFGQGLQAVGHSPASAGSMVPMLEYMGLHSTERRKIFTKSDEEANRLLQALQSITALELTEAEARQTAALMEAILQSELDIDGGELMLLVFAAGNEGVDIATGDKKALLSLPALAGTWSGLGALRERLICLEQAIERLCRVRGVKWVKGRIQGAPHADTTLREAVSHAALMPDAEFVRLLQYIVREQLSRAAPGWLKVF